MPELSLHLKVDVQPNVSKSQTLSNRVKKFIFKKSIDKCWSPPAWFYSPVTLQCGGCSEGIAGVTLCIEERRKSLWCETIWIPGLGWYNVKINKWLHYDKGSECLLIFFSIFHASFKLLFHINNVLHVRQFESK